MGITAAGLICRSQVAGRGSRLAGRRLQVAGRRSRVAGRGLQVVAGIHRYVFTLFTKAFYQCFHRN